MTAHAGLWFVDSNVVLYSFDAVSPGKRRQASQWMNALWESGAGRLSWQVLNEVYDAATWKFGLPPSSVRAVIRPLMAWRPAPFSSDVIERAWHWVDRAQLRYWDALILASAESLGCERLLTEDFQQGRKYGSVQIVNPFAASPGAS